MNFLEKILPSNSKTFRYSRPLSDITGKSYSRTAYTPPKKPTEVVSKKTSAQSRLGTAEETNRLLGGEYFDTTGKQVKAYTPTILTNANKIEEVQDGMSDLQTIKRGISIPEGSDTPQYANGEIYQEEKLLEADTDDEDSQIQSLLQQIKQSSDGATASAINGIETNFNARRVEQAAVNRTMKNAYTNALLMGGVTGEGSSAQYAPISSQGIISEVESYGIRKLAELDAQEASLIAEARAAQGERDWKIMTERLQDLRETKKEKAQSIKKINEEILARNSQMRKEAAVLDLYGKGVNDVSSILKYAKGVVTAKEAQDILDALVPKGLDDLIKTMRTNGAPPDVIQKTLQSGDMSEAYENAGFYASGGTGIVGEYNYAKAQGYTGSFTDYQNEDANRKRSIASAGVAGSSGLNSKQVAIFNSLVDKQNKSPLVAADDRAVILKDVAGQLRKDPTNAALQVSFIYSMIQALDTYQSAVREGEIGLLSSTQGLGDKIQNLPNKIQKGSPLSTNKVNEYLGVANTLVDSISRASQTKKNNFYQQAKIAGIGDAFGEYQEATSGRINNIISNDKDAIRRITDWVKSSTENQRKYNELKKMLPNASAIEIAQQLGL